jgi:hypothetical protein
MGWSPAERQEMRRELEKQGFRGDYINSWPAKTNCWRHTAWFNQNGTLVSAAGMYVPNQPADPDHALRLSTRGVLPWPPNENCKCKGCRERDWEKAVQIQDSKVPEQTLIYEGDMANEMRERPSDFDNTRNCPRNDCDWKVPSEKEGRAAVSSLRTHVSHHVRREVKERGLVPA